MVFIVIMESPVDIRLVFALDKRMLLLFWLTYIVRDHNDVVIVLISPGGLEAKIAEKQATISTVYLAGRCGPAA
jgi:hypothetical protein